MLDTLTNRLAGIVKTLRGQSRFTEENIADALREVRVALLEADVGLPVIKDFIARVKEKALGADVMQSLTPGQAFVGVVHRELIALMGGEGAEGEGAGRLPLLNALPLNLATTPPAMILMAGLQGAGKTTSAGKLAKMLKERHKKKVLWSPADVYRPAAIEQLKTLAAQVDVDLLPVATPRKSRWTSRARAKTMGEDAFPRCADRRYRRPPRHRRGDDGRDQARCTRR